MYNELSVFGNLLWNAEWISHSGDKICYPFHIDPILEHFQNQW